MSVIGKNHIIITLNGNIPSGSIFKGHVLEFIH